MNIQRDGRGGGGGGPRQNPPKGGGNGGGGSPPGGGGGSAPFDVMPPLLDLSTQLIADVIKGGVVSTAPASTIQQFLVACLSVASHLSILWTVPYRPTNFQMACVVRAAVVGQITRVRFVTALAVSRGFLLPDDPFPRIDEINSQRQIFAPLGIDATEDGTILQSVKDLTKITREFDLGIVDFSGHQPAAQLAHFEVSVDGISNQSGDPLVDILGYQPDGNFIKRKQALDSLAQLDFSKRKPYLLFTADVVVGGRRTGGTIVCWNKMRDASGYIISKREVFTATDFAPATLTAAAVQASTDSLMAVPQFRQILSFYDWIGPNDAVALLDSSNSPGSLYMYSISATQTKAPANRSLFDVPMNSLYLSTSQAANVQNLIQAELASHRLSGSVDAISPYPALAEVIYGDPGYGWVLAGCNTLASTRRGDSLDDIRGFSYIGAKASALLAAAAAGRMSLPVDVAQVHGGVDDGVAAFGISQVILGVLDGTGVTLFSSGKDDPLGFQPTQQSLQDVTGGLSRILAAIDPASALLDPTVLAASLTTRLVSGGQVRYSPTGIPATGQSAGDLERDLGTDPIDLTTYAGISDLMRLIRTVYDFYPGALS